MPPAPCRGSRKSAARPSPAPPAGRAPGVRLTVPIARFLAQEEPPPVARSPAPSAPSSSRCPPAPRRAAAAKFETSSTRTVSPARFVSWCAPSGPLGKRMQSPGSSSRSPSGVRSVGLPGDDDEQLVVPELVVVREGALTGRKLDQPRAEVLAGDTLTSPEVARRARAAMSARASLVVEQVHLHAREPTPGASLRRPTRRRAAAGGRCPGGEASCPRGRAPRRRSRRRGVAPGSGATRTAASSATPGRPGRGPMG